MFSYKKKKKKEATCPLLRKAQKRGGRGGGNVIERILHVQVHTWAFLSIKQPYFLPSIFSPFWEENFLVGPRKKHLGSIIYFPFSLPNQTYSKKVFHSPYFTSKQTCPKSSIKIFVKLFINKCSKSTS